MVTNAFSSAILSPTPNDRALIVVAFASQHHDNAERRDGPRRICRVRASVEIPGHPPLTGRVIDIGLGGMAVHLSHALPDGLSCRIRFALFAQGGIQQVDVQAQTVSSVFLSHQVRLSLRFSQLAPAVSRLLGDYVRFNVS